MGGTKRQSAGAGARARGTTVGRYATALAAALAMTLGASACRVAESDVKRWETTQRGPFKLVAVITHDKYSTDLRAEAALSLIRMPPRGGVRQGISYLVDKYKDEEGQPREGALNELNEEARRQIVERMLPALVKELEQPPPAHTPDGRLPPDPSVPFKDAAFAMLIHEPPLVGSDKARQDLRAALTKWAQTGFEDRVENGSQQFGLEQMLRYLGPDSVRTLPAIVNENTGRLDRIASLVNDVGDDATKLKMSEALVALAKRYHTRDWLDAQIKLIKESNAKNNIKADDTQVQGQLDKLQERRLTEEVLPAMKKVGGRAAVEYLFEYALDGRNSGDRRKLALAALEGRVDKNNPKDLERVFTIAKSDDTPDAARDIAFKRLGEFPKEQIIPKLYTLFEPKKWKVRWIAAETILSSISTKQVPEFMGRLPRTPAIKMGMTEGLAYGAKIRAMEPGAGEPKPRDLIASYLVPKAEFGPKMAALGFFWEGKKADQGAVRALESDTTALPKCEKDDDCSWSCDVPKAPGSKEMEPKELKTVGEFVKFCLIPSMEK